MLQEKGSLAGMENQVCQVCRGPSVPREAGEKLELQGSAFQDLKVKRGREGCQGLLDQVDPED